MSSDVDFTVPKNKNLNPKFTYKVDGVAQDISLGELTFGCVKEKDDITPLFTRENTAAGGDDTEIEWVTDGSDGEFYVHIIPANTVDLDEGTYWWQVSLILGGEDILIGEGKMYVGETFV